MSELMQSDAVNHRHWAMWVQCGIQFRSNLVEVGGVIPLHAHSYDHIAMVTHGVFRCDTISPGGDVDSFTVSSKDFSVPDSRGYRIEIPAMWKHTFTLLRADGPGEVLCMWAEGAEK